jgi:small neutral amino acid transporter SnatA (MarC family)
MHTVMTDSVASEAVGRVGATAPGPTAQPPTRPMWNPVEEARKKAELAMAAAAANGASGVMPSLGTIKPRHHTLTPRLMVAVSLVSWVFSFGVRQTLGDSDYLRVAGDNVEFTPMGRLLFIGMVGGPAGLYLSGWVWWTAAAGANARHKSEKAGSAALAPVAHALVFGLMAGLAYIATRSGDADTGIVMLLVFVAWMVTNLGILLVFRSKAAAIKAETAPWSRLLWLPLLLVVAAGIFGRVGLELPAVEIAGSVVLLAIAVWYLVSVATAMRSFDHACRTPNLARSDGEMPNFMRMAMAPR